MQDMQNEDMATRDVQPESTKGLWARNEKALTFLKRHGLEIALGAGFLASSVVCIKLGGTIELQRKLLERKDVLLRAKDLRISGLVKLSADKDRCHLKLASAALREGCSEGGRALADYRYYKSGQY